ncbi:hypothetical protein NL676_017308 [Syzygium grande]|nr:hypothetical protein NL676_017308 [Syzygium grande]
MKLHKLGKTPDFISPNLRLSSPKPHAPKRETGKKQKKAKEKCISVSKGRSSREATPEAYLGEAKGFSQKAIVLHGKEQRPWPRASINGVPGDMYEP